MLTVNDSYPSGGTVFLYDFFHVDRPLAIVKGASYDLPLGSIGRLLDEKLLHHVAEASARSFLRGLQGAIESSRS